MSTLNFMHRARRKNLTNVCPEAEWKEGVEMSGKKTYEQRTEELLLPIIEEYQFELVDVEYVKEGEIGRASCRERV